MSTEKQGWWVSITFRDMAEPMLVWYKTEEEITAFTEGFTVGRLRGQSALTVTLYAPSNPYEVMDFTPADEGEGNEPGQEG
jgi:hypothetical protein